MTIDQNSKPGKELQAVVKEELKSYLGPDYSDECLPLYIVVMLAQGTKLPAVAENLVAFLGEGKAEEFAQWLFQHLAKHPGKYETTEDAAEAVLDPEAGTKQSLESSEGRKRRREKREKIEWKEGEHGRSSKHREREGDGLRERDHREEKRRRGRDGEVRPERDSFDGAGGGESGVREKELRRLHRREALGGGEDQSRSRREDRSGEGRYREGERERQRQPRKSDPPEYDESKRDSRRGAERQAGGQAGQERPPQPGGRLAGRIGLPGAIQRPSQAGGGAQPLREGGRASVFNRLNRKGEGEPSDRARMRMDAVPAERIDDVTLDPSPEPSPQAKAPEDMMEELRNIRESLAKLQAAKEAQAGLQPTLPAATVPAVGVGAGVRMPHDPSTALAAANARKVVVHNVHFNATPDILKAHFGGCGSIASAIIEKDFQGNSKGQAVVEFVDEAARKVALTLSGSLLVGRPITVYAKETAPRPHFGGGFRPPMPPHMAGPYSYSSPTFRPRAPAPGRGGGRFRPTLKTNKYVRPQAAPEPAATAANGDA